MKDYGNFFIGGLFGGGSPSTMTQTTERIVPEWLLGDVQDMVGRAVTESERPYESYEGQRLAEFTPDQLNSMQAIRNLQGGTQPYMQQALDYAQQVGDRALGTTSLTPDSINQFMSPYQQGVTDIAKREAIKDLDKSMMGIDDYFSNVGAFGGDRQAILESEAINDTNQRLSDLQMTGLNNAYDRASNMAVQQAQLQNQGLGIAQGAATNLANIATAQQSAGLRDASALQNVGGMQQAYDQGLLDIDYQDWADAQNWEKGQLGFLSSMINPVLGNVTGSSTTTTMPQQESSPLGSILGMGLSLSGLGGGSFLGAASGPYAYSGIPQSSWFQPFAEGGLVNYGSFAEGGVVNQFPYLTEEERKALETGRMSKFTAAMRNSMRTPDEVPEYLKTSGKMLAKGVKDLVGDLPQQAESTGLAEPVLGLGDTLQSVAEGVGTGLRNYGDGTWENPESKYKINPLTDRGLVGLGKKSYNTADAVARGLLDITRTPAALTVGGLDALWGTSKVTPSEIENYSDEELLTIASDPKSDEMIKNLSPKAAATLSRALAKVQRQQMGINTPKQTAEEGVQMMAQQAAGTPRPDQIRNALAKGGIRNPEQQSYDEVRAQREAQLQQMRDKGVFPQVQQAMEQNTPDDGFFGSSQAAKDARLAAGIAMMTTKGTFGDQLGAGMKAFKDSKDSKSAAEAKAKQQKFENDLALQKADAYQRQLDLQERAQNFRNSIDLAELSLKRANQGGDPSKILNKIQSEARKVYTDAEQAASEGLIDIGDLTPQQYALQKSQEYINTFAGGLTQPQSSGTMMDFNSLPKRGQ